MPDRRPLSPSATASTSGGPGSDVKTTSDASATARGLSAHAAPARRRGGGGGARAPGGRGGEGGPRPPPPQVVNDQVVAGLLQVGRHARTHHAQPDEPYLHPALPSQIPRSAGTISSRTHLWRPVPRSSPQASRHKRRDG